MLRRVMKYESLSISIKCAYIANQNAKRNIIFNRDTRQDKNMSCIDTSHVNDASHVNTPSWTYTVANYHPINFLRKYSKTGLANPLVNKSPNCSVVSILSNLMPLRTICSRNQMVFVA